MKPVLLDLGGLEITSYGLSKALAALAAGCLLARELGGSRGVLPEPDPARS